MTERPEFAVGTKVGLALGYTSVLRTVRGEVIRHTKRDIVIRSEGAEILYRFNKRYGESDRTLYRYENHGEPSTTAFLLDDDRFLRAEEVERQRRRTAVLREKLDRARGSMEPDHLQEARDAITVFLEAQS